MVAPLLQLVEFVGGKSANPTIALTTKTTDTGTTGVFNSLITGLTTLTTYYVRAYATNSVGTSYGNEISFVTLVDYTGQTGTVNDIEANTYNTIGIGSQIWMAENLKTTKYNDGTAIPYITDRITWAAATASAYCDYHDNPSNSTTFGRLYNWYAVDKNASSKVASNGGKNVCPTGWHVPTDVEWTTLTTELGGESVAGGKLKETGITHWASPNTGATNETGFTALPCGYHDDYGDYYYGTGGGGGWWSSTESLTASGWYRLMRFDWVYVERSYASKRYGFSIRCLKD